MAGDIKSLIVNIDEVAAAHKSLKKCLLIYSLSFAALAIVMPLAALVNNTLFQNIIGILACIFALFFFLFRFIIIFKLRYVYKPMGKSIGFITVFQLASLLIPFGAWIFGFIALREANKIIKQS